MRKLLTLLLLTPLLSMGQEVFGITGYITPNTIPNYMNGKTAVIIGNSITYGIAATDNAHRWSTLFAVAMSATEDNRGVSGRTLQGSGCTDDFVNSVIPSYNSSTHGALIIALGVNDQGQNNGVSTPTAFETKFLAAISYATGTAGWPLDHIILLTPFWVSSYTGWVGSCSVVTPSNVTRHEQYVQKVKDVAGASGVYVIDIYTAMRDSPLKGTFLDADGVHPNNTGMAWIATYIKNSFQSY